MTPICLRASLRPRVCWDRRPIIPSVICEPSPAIRANGKWTRVVAHAYLGQGCGPVNENRFYQACMVLRGCSTQDCVTPPWFKLVRYIHILRIIPEKEEWTLAWVNMLRVKYKCLCSRFLCAWVEQRYSHLKLSDFSARSDWSNMYTGCRRVWRRDKTRSLTL